MDQFLDDDGKLGHGFTSVDALEEIDIGEASPHKRRLKYDTNISPRRLMTHLLHQMVHHHTTLRGNGQ